MVADANDADGMLSDGSPAVLDADSEAPPESHSDTVPLSIASPHLRLWLTAAAGISCASGRVVSWADQSYHHDDATLQHGQLGPQCQVSGGQHSVGGVDLPYFSAPLADGGLDVLAETLDVDLSFLANTAYTIFTVERRWTDPGIEKNEELILGTTMPLTIEQANPMGCPSRYQNLALFVGYVYYSSYPQFVLDQTCNTLSATAPPVPVPGPAAMTQHTVQLDLTLGRQIWVDGHRVATDLQTTPLPDAEGGAIGRALLQTPTTGVDPRFRGDIAEIVVYDVTLSVEDQAAIEADLQGRWERVPSNSAADAGQVTP